MKSHILIIKGGVSTERAVSLSTGSTVEGCLERAGIRFRSLDVLEYDDILKYDLSNVIYVFIALHGGFGEDGTVQLYLKKKGIPHNGAGSLASFVGMHKQVAKLLTAFCGISSPRSLLAERNRTAPSFQDASAILGKKLIVKPCSQGCSVGVSLVESEGQYNDAVALCGEYKDDILIEEFISGQEIALFHLTNHSIPIIEVNYSQEFFSHDAKFNSKDTTYFEKSKVSRTVERKVREAASLLVDLYNIEDYCRFDFIIKSETVYFIEINTLPGLVNRPAYVEHSDLESIDQIIQNILSAKLPSFILETAYVVTGE